MKKEFSHAPNIGLSLPCDRMFEPDDTSIVIYKLIVMLSNLILPGIENVTTEILNKESSAAVFKIKTIVNSIKSL